MSVVLASHSKTHPASRKAEAIRIRFCALVAYSDFEKSMAADEYGENDEKRELRVLVIIGMSKRWKYIHYCAEEKRVVFDLLRATHRALKTCTVVVYVMNLLEKSSIDKQALHLKI